MSNLNESQNNNSNNKNKEKSFNLVQTIINDPNLLNLNQQQNYMNHFQNQNNLNNNISNQLNSRTNNNPNTLIMEIMKEMRSKISSNDYTSIKELLKNSSIISQKAKNQLLNLSFNKYNISSNRNQRKVIIELINHGADPNYKLELNNTNNIKNKSSNNFSSIPNKKINPLIFCCIKGDIELYELIKNKVNLSTRQENNNNSYIYNNYFFYIFDNNMNMENKYKILNDILLIKKSNNNINININDYDIQTGMTVLMLSVLRQYINFINLFLENGADINIKNLKDGNTALHYAALVKNKDIIELLLKSNNCDLLIKNNNNETIVDVASNNNCSTEIYTLLASKYDEQQKLFEEKKSQEELSNNDNNNIDYEINNINNGSYNYNGYIKNNNSNMNENDNIQGFEDELDIIKKNQVNNNTDNLSSYLEIPFQFVNHLNFINYYDANNMNNNILDFNQNEINSNGNIRNYLRFKNTPTLNINLKTQEDEDLLILDNLKNENDKLDIEFSQIENKLEQVYNDHNKLLAELNKVNNEIKSINNDIESYSKQIKERETIHLNEIKKVNMQKNAENSILDILLSQENFLNLKNCHEKFFKDEEYLNKKFSEEIFDENQIKSNLVKDIIDFQRYIKYHVKEKQKPIYNIRDSLQEILEINGLEYIVYVFGSYATGLCLTWSDLDLILISKNPNVKTNNSILKLQEITNILNNINWVDKPNLITDYYAFPYITFSTDQDHGFMKVNLTIQDKKNNGFKCVKLIKDFLNIYKNLEPLTLIVKQLMKCANTLFSLSNYLNNPSENLNSYSIILMIVYFFQLQIMGRTIDVINNPDNLGELFINFLLYYVNFNYNEKNYIFVRTGLKDSLENDDYLHLNSFRSKLIIIDPLDHKNNVSLNTAEFRSIQFILRLIYYSSRVKCDCSCHYLKNNNINEDEEKNSINEEKNQKYVELGTEHCILKKIFKTAYRINSNLLKVVN